MDYKSIDHWKSWTTSQSLLYLFMQWPIPSNDFHINILIPCWLPISAGNRTLRIRLRNRLDVVVMIRLRNTICDDTLWRNQVVVCSGSHRIKTWKILLAYIVKYTYTIVSFAKITVLFRFIMCLTLLYNMLYNNYNIYILIIIFMIIIILIIITTIIIIIIIIILML